MRLTLEIGIAEETLEIGIAEEAHSRCNRLYLELRYNMT